MGSKILIVIHFTINRKHDVANIVAVRVKLQVSIHVMLLENDIIHYSFHFISILYFPIRIYMRIYIYIYINRNSASMYSKKTSVIKIVTVLELKMQRKASIPKCQIPIGLMSKIWTIFPLSCPVSVGTGVRS
jgi:hypothetical protein